MVVYIKNSHTLLIIQFVTVRITIFVHTQEFLANFELYPHILN